MQAAADRTRHAARADDRLGALDLAMLQAEQAAWEAAYPGLHDEEAFRRDVLPKLASVSMRQIQHDALSENEDISTPCPIFLLDNVSR